MVALRSTPVRGLETEWVDEGAGSAGRPVLFFIHGFPDDARVWEEQIAHFSKEYRVIAPQLRGAGGSSAGLTSLASGTVNLTSSLIEGTLTISRRSKRPLMDRPASTVFSGRSAQ